MSKSLVIVLALLMSACGGGDGDDTEIPSGSTPLSADEIGALSLQCLGHRGLASARRVHWDITIDGVRIVTYARGSCSDGSEVALISRTPA